MFFFFSSLFWGGGKRNSNREKKRKKERKRGREEERKKGRKKEKKKKRKRKKRKGGGLNIHPIRIHGLSGIEIEILEIGRNVFGIVILSPILEGFYFLLVGALLFELFDHFFEVACTNTVGGISLVSILRMMMMMEEIERG